jgi:S-adenosyl-L-methionine hydrolase (adenosine-forming)
MQLITFTTDYGTKDHYAAVLKAGVLSACPAVTLLDISHEIMPFNIPHAELVACQAIQNMPIGSIHVICVRTHYQSQPEWLYLEANGQRFIAPNHGILAMLYPDAIHLARKINIEAESQVSLIAQSIWHIVHESDLSAWTSTDFVVTNGLKLRPVITRERLRGTVIYTDHFGNALTNITKTELLAWVGDSEIKILLKRNEILTGLSDSFGDVPQGEPLATWNEHQLLTIAINHGNANILLNLEANDVIDIVKGQASTVK